MMPGYLIVDIASIRNRDVYARYRAEVTSSLKAAGGRYLARGGPIEVLEGNWRPSRVVLVRFETIQAAKEWWTSSDYADLKQMRQDSTETNMILVEGSERDTEPAG